MILDSTRALTVERQFRQFLPRQNGEKIGMMACYAALPVALDPTLVHLIRVNFFNSLPFEAESEFLLSKLCNEIGNGLYEIPPDMRTFLLKRLFESESGARVRKMAALLWEYSASAPWPDNEQLTRAQQLTALNILDPAKAKEWLDSAENSPRNRLNAPAVRDWFVVMRAEMQWLVDIAANVRPSAQITDFYSLRIIADFIMDFYDLEELLTLAFVLGIDIKSFVGRDKREVVVQLVNYVADRGLKNKLIEQLQRDRSIEYASKFGAARLEVRIPSDTELKQFILRYFSENEFEDLCFDYFPDFSTQLIRGMVQSRKVNSLINYCIQNNQVENLRAAIARERAEAWRDSFFAVSKKPLSKRQRKMLEFIRKYISSHNRFPTRSEIGKEVGINSISVVNYNIGKLVEAGYIVSRPDVPGGLRLAEVGQEQYLSNAILRRDPRQIFISYSSIDTEFANRLASDLRSAGWGVWLASDSIRPGEKWEEAIGRGLETSGIFLLVLTQATAFSQHVRKEQNTAIDLESKGELRLIPLILQKGKYPPTWMRYLAVHFDHDYSEGLRDLLNTLSPPSLVIPVAESDLKLLSLILAQFPLFRTASGRREVFMRVGLDQILEFINLDLPPARFATELLKLLNNYDRSIGGEWALGRLLKFLLANDSVSSKDKDFILEIFLRYSHDEEDKPEKQKISRLIENANLQYKNANYKYALDQLDEALAIDPWSLEALTLRARVLVEMGYDAKALKNIDEALNVARKTGNIQAETTILADLNVLLIRFVNSETSINSLEMALDLARLSENYPLQSTILEKLGNIHVLQNHLTRARELLEAALEIRERVLGPDHIDTANIYNSLDKLLEQIGDVRTARIFKTKAIAAYTINLENEDSKIRMAAVEALGRIGGDTEVTVLLHLLEDENSIVRSAAAEALGRIGSEQAVSSLLHGLDDEDAGVRLSAKKAITMIRPDLELRGEPLTNDSIEGGKDTTLPNHFGSEADDYLPSRNEFGTKIIDYQSPQYRRIHQNMVENVYASIKPHIFPENEIESRNFWPISALQRPIVLIEGKEVPRPPSSISEISSIFINSGRSLLILGQPGSGKTMTLLYLCTKLLQNAEADFIQPVPVILNLRTWKYKPQFLQQNQLSEWIIEELWRQYGLAKAVSSDWLIHDHLILLLDGLDEVTPKEHNSCIRAINHFHARYSAGIVVCSRPLIYLNTKERLNLTVTIEIRT